MNQRKILVFMLTLFCLLAFGCAKTNENEMQSIAFTDDAGRALSFASPPENMIVMTPAGAEILGALGAQDSVLAVGEYCNFPASIDAKPKVATGANTSLEEIIAMKPDCVIIAKMAQDIGDSELLESAGIPVVVIDAADISTVYDDIHCFGLLTGKTEAADDIIKKMQDEFAALESDISQIAEKKSAYVEISPLEYGLWTCGMNTFQNELLQSAGIINAFADIDGWQQISEEQVIARNPDYIITSVNQAQDGNHVVDEIYNRENWQSLQAVQNNQTVYVDADMLSRGGPRLAQTARLLFETVYESKP